MRGVALAAWTRTPSAPLLRTRTPTALLGGVMAATLAVLLAGCARTAEERQLDSMREDIDSIQNNRDRNEPGAPGTAGDGPAGGARIGRGAAPNPASGPPTPGPEGSQVGTGDSLPGDPTDPDYVDPEDTQSRPKIRVVGTPRTGGRGNRDQVEQVVSDENASQGSTLDPEAKRAYDAALAQVNAKQYAAALGSLAAFLVKWPDHPYADHALYWRGECFFAQGDFVRAKEQFEGVLARFPAGMKAPDALYKLALCQQKLGQAADARASLDRLAQQYPQSDAARRLSSPASGAREGHK